MDALHLPRVQLAQKLIGEVQSRSWRSDGAGLVCIDSLITLAVFHIARVAILLALDIRRQRHSADSAQKLKRRFAQLNSKDILPALKLLDQRCIDRFVATEKERLTEP